MKKIDKSKILSTEYKKWEENLERNNSNHPKYNSSGNEFYYDIVMNLLYNQKGLCAYTEVQLCPMEFLNHSNWNNGRYVNHEKVFNGELEHFDEKLKSKKKDTEGIKDWLYSNLFVIDSDTNNRKGIKEVDYILKPDSIEYNEFDLLDYDIETHRFIAKITLPNEDRIRIDRMINEVLGLNFPNLVDKRRNVILKAFEFGTDIYENEFPTAFEFYRKEQNANIQ